MPLLPNTAVSLLEQGEPLGCRGHPVASLAAGARGGLAQRRQEFGYPSWGSLWAHSLSWRIRRLQQHQSLCFCSVQAPVLALEGICLFGGSFSGGAWGFCKCCPFLLCSAACRGCSVGCSAHSSPETQQKTAWKIWLRSPVI